MMTHLERGVAPGPENMMHKSVAEAVLQCQIISRYI